MASSYSFANTFKSYFTHTLYQEERNYIYSFLPSILLDHVTLKSDSLPKYQCLCKKFMASKIVLEIQLQVDRKQNRSCDSVTNDQLTIRQIDNNFFAHMKELPFLHTWPIDKFFAHMANRQIFCTHGQLTIFCTLGQLTIFCTHGQLTMCTCLQLTIRKFCATLLWRRRLLVIY